MKKLCLALLIFLVSIGFVYAEDGLYSSYGDSGGTPSYVTIDLTGITDGNIPYMQGVAAGFGDSPLTTDGTDLTSTGAYNGTTISLIRSALPSVVWRDSDMLGTDPGDAMQFFSDCTDTADGTWDCDGYLRQKVNGSDTTTMFWDADGDIEIGSATQNVQVNGVLMGLEKSADPAEPAEGTYVIWMSDGTGKGDDGDIMIASQAGGTTKYGTLFDHSSGGAW